MMRGEDFLSRCEALFAPQHGRRWKAACAGALGIGRASLYRYFSNKISVPEEVLAGLTRIEQPSRPAISSRDMLALYARALVELQDCLDRHGSLKGGYPENLRRAFDLASALNAADGSATWPVELGEAVQRAAQPLYKWVQDLSWDVDGEFTAARLIQNGAVSTECFELAGKGFDPEAELRENAGYERLIKICFNRSDGPEFYRNWRRLVIERPVIQSVARILNDYPVLMDRDARDLLGHFYQPVPESMAALGSLRICKMSGTLLRPLDRGGKRHETDCRDPAALKQALSGTYDTIEFSAEVRQLARPFRIFWCLPGRAELEVERKLSKAGWNCVLWPELDRVDIVAQSPDRKRKIAIDVKDYLSPATLARTFEGFKEFARSHECLLVVPDYLRKVTPDYERRFFALRESWRKLPVRLTTVSKLVKELS